MTFPSPFFLTRSGTSGAGLFLCVFCMHNPSEYAKDAMHKAEYTPKLLIFYAKSTILYALSWLPQPVVYQLFAKLWFKE